MGTVKNSVDKASLTLSYLSNYKELDCLSPFSAAESRIHSSNAEKEANHNEQANLVSHVSSDQVRTLKLNGYGEILRKHSGKWEIPISRQQ
jgi:hypothetical protein